MVLVGAIVAVEVCGNSVGVTDGTIGLLELVKLGITSGDGVEPVQADTIMMISILRAYRYLIYSCPMDRISVSERAYNLYYQVTLVV